MSRQDFDVDIVTDNSTLRYANGKYRWNYSAVARNATESTTGTSRRKPTGFLDPTPYEFLKINTDYQRGSCYNGPEPPPTHPTTKVGQIYTGIVGASNGRFNGDSHFDTTMNLGELVSIGNVLRNKALIGVRNNLKNQQINLGIALGESRRTARLVGDTAFRLVKSVRLLKAGRIRNAMDVLGISSSRRQPRGNNVPRKWLELQYGWKPLLNDVYGAASALEQRQKGDWRVTAKATRSEDHRTTKSFGGYGASTCGAEASVSVFARLDALPSNEAIISLSSLGVTNPLSVAWELVPFSFVVDWMLPIGSFLNSLDAGLGYSSISYSSSLLIKAKWEDKGRNTAHPSKPTWTIKNDFRGTKELTYLKREVSNSLPMPSLPSLKDPRSLGHMANGLALLSQVFGRGSRSRNLRLPGLINL